MRNSVNIVIVNMNIKYLLGCVMLRNWGGGVVSVTNANVKNCFCYICYLNMYTRYQSNQGCLTAARVLTVLQADEF